MTCSHRRGAGSSSSHDKAWSWHRWKSDFAAVAEAFGAAGYRVRGPEALEATLTKALADRRPAVIEVQTELGGTATPWKYLMPRWTSAP